MRSFPPIRFRIAAAAFFAFTYLLAAPQPGEAQDQQSQYPFQNTQLSSEQRIDDLISRLTLDEKIYCLGTDPSIPRLGVRGTGHVEGLHGLALGGPGGWQGKGKTVIPTTQFPQARGLGQTWDPALIEQAAAVEGYETRYAWQNTKYHRGGLVVRAPNADLSRDPRWGRSEESYGEDPFLVGTLAVAFVKGLQGHDPHYWQTASLMKHFLANSNENGRGGSSSDFDERLFHEYYAVPFRMGIEQGGSNAFMTAYNAWNHIPMAAQPVLHAVVERQWGFNGIICTDAGALTNMVTQHHYYPDLPHAAAGAIHAGINQFLDRYQQPVGEAYAQKLITDADIDANLKGVFRVMLRLGMLDPPAGNPYASIGNDAAATEKGDSEKSDSEKSDPWTWPEHRALARKVTDESIVLLKNEHATLPLDATAIHSITVIGRYADQVLLDWYSGTPPYAITPLEGIRARAGKVVEVRFATGQDIPAAVALARQSDVVIAVVGNHPTCDAGWNQCPSPSDGKEAVDRKSIDLQQEALLQQIYAANPRTIAVLTASFPFAAVWTQQHLPAVLTLTHNSEEEGSGLADVLFGDYDPGGRLTQTWPASLDQLPPMMDYNIRHGRTYLYAKQTPLYPFGYGISYSQFSYRNLKVSLHTLHAEQTASVSFDVVNTGKRDGDEVAQLYVKHLDSKVDRPIQELKGFARVHIAAASQQRVTIPLTASTLRYWDDARHAFMLEPDRIELRIGSNSQDIRLHRTIVVRP
jgi:beta-glucosidase